MLEIETLLSADPLAESSRLIQRSEKALAAALLAGSARPVRAAISFLKLKYPVTYQQLRPIAELLWAIFLRVGGNVHEEADVADSLSFVLKLLNKLPDCPPHGTPERLVLPWKPLSDALLKVQMHGLSAEEWSVAGPSEIPIGAEARKMHGQALTALIRRARNFFESNAAIEIVKYLTPYMCPHEAGLYRTVGLLCLMIPEYVEASFINDACSLWHSIPNCLEWSYLWTHLFSRLTRHNSSLVVPALQSHLPKIFESLLFLLEMPSSKDAAQRPELLTWPPDCSFLVTKTSLKNEIVKKMTRLIVYSIGPHSSTWDLLKNLVLYLRPFFHPLNEGGWTSSLDMFLKMLTLNFSKRVGIERRTHRAKRPWITLSPLSVDEEINFVQLMLPLALTAFESKDYIMSFGAAQALKDLVSLQPDTVLPLVTDRLIPALENSMKPHEALNSMEAFSVILGPLLRSPGGIEHAVIAQMLQQTVLGIDNNDPMKTVKTLRLYMRFVTLTPLLHPKDVPATKPEWVYILPEWTITVIDRLWSFLCNIPAIKKGSGLDYVLSRNVIRHFLDTFFQQMSPTLYTTALKHICQKISSTYYPPAKKYFGQILDASVYSNGEGALKDLMPLIVNKIMDKGNLLGNGSETAYWVHLFGHLVARSGEHLLPLLPTVTGVVDAVVMHDDKDLRKEGQKLLRKVLRSFLTIRPADFRSLPAEEWNFEKCSDVSRLVHPDIVASLSAVKFLYPSDTSQRQAQVLVEKYFALVEKRLLSADAVVPPPTLRACFGCLEALVRGASALFPDEEAPVFDSSLSEADIEEGMDESEGNVGLCLGVGIGITDWGKNFRTSISALLNRLCKVYSVRENPDVVSVKALLRVLQFFLSEKGYGGPNRDQVNYNKAVYRLWNQGMSGTFTRNMVVQKAYALLTRRMASGVWAVSAQSQPLLENLVSMSMHEYSVVRKKAQKAIPKILIRYPRFSNHIVSSALEVFCVDKSSKAVVNGAIYTINTAVMLKHIARQWKHTSSLVHGLLMSHHFEDMKVQVRLAELWNAFVPYTGRLGFVSAAPIADESILDVVVQRHFTIAQAQAAVLCGANLRRAVFVSQEAIYNQIIENIMKALGEAGKLHWRFTLLAASSLSILLRCEKAPTPELLQFFLTGLTSEILPLRQLCRLMFPTIIRFSNTAASMDVCKENESAMDMDTSSLTFKDFDLPLSEEFWDGPYIDGLWRGWDGSVDVSQNLLFNKNVSHVHEAIKGWLLCKDKVDRFCELLASDHRLSGDERASDSDKSAMAGMPLPSAAVSSLFEASWHWPRTSAASFSTAISKQNIFVLETIIRSGGLAGLNTFWAHLETSIAKQGDREAQCLAAELLAGLVRGTSSTSAAADRKEIDSRLERLVGSALAHIPLESTGDWMEALRLCVCNRDPRRFQWLSRAVANLSANLDSSTSTSLNGLKLKQALLIEFGWRGYSFAAAIADQLFSLLSGSSKSVREEAARCLVLVSQIDACLPTSSTSIRPRLGGELSCSREALCQRFPSIFRRLVEAYNATASGGNTCPKSLKEEVEGVLYYFIHASRLGRTSSTGPFVCEAIGLLLAVHEDGDREFAQVGKISSQLVCSSSDFTILSNLLDSAASIFSLASSWRVRLGALDAVRAISHRLVLDSNPRNRALKTFKDGLTDKVLDVRIFAHLCLAGLLRMVPSEDIMAIIAEAPKSRRRGKMQGQIADNIELRHGKVLGVSAAVLSHPTDLPEWMADAVTALCSLNDEDPVIKQSIINTIGEFKKTHQDVWPVILMTWSSEQLSLMSDYVGARSYYS